MKTTRLCSLLLALAIAAPAPLFLTGCPTVPSERVVQVQTLKSVGQGAEAALVLSAKLYASGQIGAAQARQVMDFYDKKFQPAFRLAKDAVQGDLSSIATPDVIALSAQLLQLIASFQPSTSTK